jgi:hypothetical protein
MTLPKETPMIEILALAILNSDREAAGLPHAESRESILDSDGYVRNARAVLTALLEPTPEMVARGVRYAMNVRIGSPEDPHWPDYIHNMFRAMIQTALTEGEG